MKTNMLNIKKAFQVDVSEMRKIVKNFHSEMEKGLNGDKSSLKMLATFTAKPSGKERGSFYALDLGGTNFRIIEVLLKQKGNIIIKREEKFVLPKNCIKGDQRMLFGFIAQCFKAFVKKGSTVNRRNDTGFTFSFPVRLKSLNSGILLQWTKEFAVKNTVGCDVVKLLNEALSNLELNNINITALVNDTVGTMAACAYKEKDCDVGVILGTGTNACYVEKIKNIKKNKNLSLPGGNMIINIEWGNFNKLNQNKYDLVLDRDSLNKGKQVLEKMVSGMYLGEIVRLVLLDLINNKLIFKDYKKVFSKKWHLETKNLSLAESDTSKNLGKISNVLRELNVKHSTLDERKLFLKVCKLVSERAARISAASLSAVLLKGDHNLSKKHTIAIDGSLFEKHPNFAKNMKKALKEIFHKNSNKIKLVLSKDGSGRGAAVIAAWAASRQR